MFKKIIYKKKEKELKLYFIAQTIAKKPSNMQSKLSNQV